MDVIIMEPFDILEASRISIEMFNKTLDKNSKIKTFRTKKLHIHRSKPGVIHYDGDPVMTGEDIDVEIKPKGIKSSSTLMAIRVSVNLMPYRQQPVNCLMR